MEYHLLTFLAVCQEMNYTRAAEVLHITQPAVSHQIRWLEEEYAASLFRTEGRKLFLTPAGMLLREAASGMKSEEEVLRRRMRAAEKERQSLRLGATRTIGDFVVARPLGSYVKHHPQMELHMTVGNTEELLDALRRKRIDCAMIEGFFDGQEFDSVVYKTEPFVPVCAAEHAFTHPPRTLRDLLGERLLIRENGSGTRMLLEKALQREQLRLRDFAAITQVGSMHALLAMLEQEVGVSFMYRVAAAALIHEGRLAELTLDGFPLTHDFALVWSKGSPEGSTFRQLCRDIIEEENLIC